MFPPAARLWPHLNPDLCISLACFCPPPAPCALSTYVSFSRMFPPPLACAPIQTPTYILVSHVCSLRSRNLRIIFSHVSARRLLPALPPSKPQLMYHSRMFLPTAHCSLRSHRLMYHSGNVVPKSLLKILTHVSFSHVPARRLPAPSKLRLMYQSRMFPPATRPCVLMAYVSFSHVSACRSSMCSHPDLCIILACICPPPAPCAPIQH